MIPAVSLPGSVGEGQTVELAVFFAIGVFGGAHCIGMCGPLVTLYSEAMSKAPAAGEAGPTWFEIRQHGLFNLGRTVSYAVLGGLFGLVGLFFYSATSVTHVSTLVRAVVGVLAGVFIISVGVYRSFGRMGSVLSWLPFSLGVGRAFGRVYGAITERVNRLATNPGIVGLGALHGLLPCPLLYPAFLYAFSQGSPVHGVLDLAALGLGTFPTLFLYGTIIGSVDTAHRVRLHQALGVVFIVLGYIPLAMGLNMFGVHVPMIKPPFYQPLG
ncbi:MAG: sulfite exporter TauE/SafE family protein [Salinigranum sp.]